MSEPKPFASLSSGLLARKGAARPAMRPQGFAQAGQSLEDLGWDDMGFEPPKPVEVLRDAGHDALHTLDLPKRNRTTDAEIHEISAREHRVVITKDADFVNSRSTAKRLRRHFVPFSEDRYQPPLRHFEAKPLAIARRNARTNCV